ncbi:MAG: ATP-binding protein [Hespellia sp.]|nr:ATP-binding protein [Hespellia sp.]
MGELLQVIEENAGVILIVLVLILVCEMIVYFLKFRNKNQHKHVRREAEVEEFYHELSKNGKDVFILVRKSDSMAAYVSQNAKNILGIEPQLIMDDLWAVERAMDARNCRRLKTEVQRWDHASPLEIELAYRNIQTKKPYWGLIQICETESGKYYLCMVEDITREHEMWVKMQKEIEEVHRIDESKTTFLSKMSHEIRTPMNGMLGMISLAKLNIGNAQEAGEYLEKAEGLSQFLLSIINDILDMSRIENGKVELAKEKVDIFAVAEKLRSMFQTTVEDKGIRFVVEVKDFTVRYVIGDELRMVQVMTNFLSNASKFTSAGGEISVTFRQMRIVGDKVNIMMRVRDTGKGMSQEFLSRIFNPFEQESTATVKEHGGSGLGMSIADNMVHLMGGEITVSSELGKGTVFTVFLELPIAVGDQSPPSEVAHIEKKTEEESLSIAGYRLLLAEDNNINALIAKKLLKACGAEVECAANGRIAVEMFRKKQPGYYDVILMDIQMPELNGWEATRVIRSLDRADAHTIPILALSADAFVEDKRKSVEMGMNGHVAKPIDFKELALVIRKCVGK